MRANLPCRQLLLLRKDCTEAHIPLLPLCGASMPQPPQSSSCPQSPSVIPASWRSVRQKGTPFALLLCSSSDWWGVHGWGSEKGRELMCVPHSVRACETAMGLSSCRGREPVQVQVALVPHSTGCSGANPCYIWGQREEEECDPCHASGPALLIWQARGTYRTTKGVTMTVKQAGAPGGMAGGGGV